MYQVIVRSNNVKHLLAKDMTYVEALKLCEESNWVYDWNGGLMWEMEIEEVAPILVMNRSKYYLNHIKYCQTKIDQYQEQLHSEPWCNDTESVEMLTDWILSYEAEKQDTIQKMKKRG